MSTYPHMCRMNHVEIGHADSEHERCPLCRVNDRAWELEQQNAELRAALEQVNRMCIFPDDVINRTTLMAAILLARAALAKGGA